MNPGRGVFISQEPQSRDSWTPVTPGKPTPQRSGVEVQGNQQTEKENWQELVGMYSNLLQKVPGVDGLAEGFNPTTPSARIGGNQNKLMRVAVAHTNMNPHFNQTSSSHFLSKPLNVDGAVQDFNLTAPVDQNGGNQKWVAGLTEKIPSLNQPTNSHTHSFGANPRNLDGAVQDFNMTARLIRNAGNQEHIVGITENNQSSNQTPMSQANTLRSEPMNLNGMSQNFTLKRLMGLGDKPPFFNQTESSVPQSFHANIRNFNGPVQGFNLNAPMAQNRRNQNLLKGLAEKTQIFNQPTRSDTQYYHASTTKFDQGFNLNAPVSWNGDNQSQSVNLGNTNPCFDETACSWTYSFPANVTNFDGGNQNQDSNFAASMGHNAGNQKWVVGMNEKSPRFNQTSSRATQAFCTIPSTFDGANHNSILTTHMDPNGGNQNRLAGRAKNQASSNQTTSSYTHSFRANPVNVDGMSQNFNLIGAVDLNGGTQNQVMHLAEKNLRLNGTAISHVNSFVEDPANCSELLESLLGIKNPEASFAQPVNGEQSKGDLVLNRSSSFSSTMNEAQHKSTPFKDSIGSFASLNSDLQVQSNWEGNQNQTSTPTKDVHEYTPKQLSIDGFPVPYRSYYNLNSPPTSEADAASSITDPFQIAPITPNIGKHIEKQCQSEINYSPVDESSAREKERHGNLMVSMRSDNAENNIPKDPNNALLHTIGESSSSVISTTQKEHNIFDEGDGQGIDLNKTPQQKTPKRRKHRPKVVIEGKPKRTPKAKTPGSTSNENAQSGKRKYVRKKGLDNSETPQTNDGPQSVQKRKYVRKKDLDNNSKGHQPSGVAEVTASAAKFPAKSCRRQLNFDLECGEMQNTTNNHQMEETEQEGNKGLNMNSNPQETEQAQINSSFAPSAMRIGQQNGFAAGITSKALFSEENAPRTPIAKAHALNVIARNLSMRNSIPGQNSSWRNGYHQVSQNVGCQAANSSCSNLDRTKAPQFDNDLPGYDERRGTKRRPGEQIYPDIVNSVDDSAFRYREFPFPVEPCNSSRNYLENHKKARTNNGFYAAISAEDNTVLEMRRTNVVYGNGSILKSLNPIEVANAVYMNADKCHPQPMVSPHNIQKHPVSSGMQQAQTDRMATKRSQGLIQVHEMSPLTAIVNWNPLPKEASTCDYLQDIVSCCANVPEQKQSAKPSSSNQIRFPGHSKMLQQRCKDSVDGQEQTSAKARGVPKKQNFQLSIDDITNQMEDLKICGDNEQEQHALVPYKGDGSIIPFEPIKKRKPRPKVDLDPETDRLWRLLMGKEGSEGAEALDKDKEEWWKNERKVFRGRADSFIARMRLVQGDRRFSRWKGSVVDSVIGVFLTQNVSDHLSSSAFMSLAAKFPLKSTSPSEACSKNGACVLVEEPIQIVKPNGYQTQPLFNLDQMRHSVSGPRGEYNRHNKISEEEIISSQDSFDSSILQTADEIRSSSGSNSEAEDQATVFEPNKNLGRNPANLLGAQATMFNRFFNLENWSSQVDERPENVLHQSIDPECNMQHLRMTKNSNIHIVEGSGSGSGSQTLGVQFGGISGDESLYSFPLSASGITKACHTSNTASKQNELPRQAPIPGQHDFSTNHRTHLQRLQGGPHIGNSAHFIDNRQEVRSETFQLEGSSKPPSKHSETLARSNTSNTNEDSVSVVDKLSYIQSTIAEVRSKEQKSPFSGAGTNLSKSRKGAADVEKKRAFDWDSLRKQARPNGEKRERSKDATDSMDYEALRSADVKKISDAIRERGMNNMLADRMKDFLNRLVREHGSIDLEWLRDVPPDKAKEYLLSIRGLGLKSVECVRLLTLHHLAFPVDTNVGRIAVRLGWVPLQPLPESLQLHLLELYPVLETIQKYIWPRLCTLDQLTLYELHYHMITFGKVFCTKSKPNCNACPMRAECRHFASAFASARLALPGPEEKSIVSSDVPVAADRSRPTMIINPIPQLLPAENPPMDRGFFERICEPIIEEPATPEPETNPEISESDIEDNGWFEEDPEDIPTIKLNMEEFSTNLHNLMQDNTDDDMSKALVALNPEAASIPTPKLKNVSRLRTEHQVYELPDSHPLLEGLDKREPDDPSPYLLAIWTPGETANSTQPPEGTCPAQATGKLCIKKTCVTCNGIREADLQIVRGTLLIPCRTAMRGSFPLNGTYFQVNEMFADHESSVTPIDVPRSWIWNLPRRIVYFGTSVSTIFKGLTTEGIQYCFWRGFVCVRGFDRKTRAPRPLRARLHFPASKLVKTKNEDQ